MGELSLIFKPDAEEAEAAELYVDGEIGGKAYRFLFDTGAGKSSVVSDDYTATFPSAEQHHSSGVFARSREDLITVPSIDLGAISKRDFTLVRAADGSGRGNLIGMDLLHEFRLHFRFNKNSISVDEDTEALDFPLQELRLDARFHPYIEIQFDAATANAVWDTGASLSVVDMTFVKNHPALFEEAGQSTGTDSTGAQVETPMFLMRAFLIGSCPFPACRAAGVDLSAVNATLEIPMEMILGYNTFHHATWLFDFPRRQWAISKRL